MTSRTHRPKIPKRRRHTTQPFRTKHNTPTRPGLARLQNLPLA
jgi:hypothetical protein